MDGWVCTRSAGLCRLRSRCLDGQPSNPPLRFLILMGLLVLDEPSRRNYADDAGSHLVISSIFDVKTSIPSRRLPAGVLMDQPSDKLLPLPGATTLDSPALHYTSTSYSTGYKILLALVIPFARQSFISAWQQEHCQSSSRFDQHRLEVSSRALQAIHPSIISISSSCVVS